MDKLLIALLCGLSAGCASRTWEEPTERTRAVGDTRVIEYLKPGAQQFLRVETEQQADGYQYAEDVDTSTNGKATIDILPIAVMVLYYNKPMKIQIYRYDDERVISSTEISHNAAIDVVSRRAAQVKLGLNISLRKGIMAMLDDLTQAQPSPLTDNLKVLRINADIRPEWR